MNKIKIWERIGRKLSGEKTTLVKIKTWERMKEEFGVSKDLITRILCNGVFTCQMERALPANRVVRLNDYNFWGNHPITEDMIERHLDSIYNIYGEKIYVS